MYMTLVSILRTFIRAGRTGNWLLYLQALQQMLPYLAAAGHEVPCPVPDTNGEASSLMVTSPQKN